MHKNEVVQTKYVFYVKKIKESNFWKANKGQHPQIDEEILHLLMRNMSKLVIWIPSPFPERLKSGTSFHKFSGKVQMIYFSRKIKHFYPKIFQQAQITLLVESRLCPFDADFSYEIGAKIQNNW